ncbi:hypothetical protein OG562_20240 [Streptomyces sp. NBC_01275]|uniref:hypothetical protein n=1 Tax=Streptomyces sp. NBC_01275 TaxID=2903807 RepID=UPI00224FB0F1|nr:hypothetical protein [Streptomyces sp. NBC_01275]MCX4763256.1 hypothetical protein [Streptomyces sp. NBC_01275]
MADKVSQQLWDQLMAGTSPKRFEAPEPKLDATTQKVVDQARGRTDYSSVHESNAEGRERFERAVRARARVLENQGVPHAETAARTQLQREAREATEAASRRATYDAMSQTSDKERERAYWEERANRPLRADRSPEPGAPYVTPNGETPRRDRTSERLMAQANGVVFNIYDQEQNGG